MKQKMKNKDASQKMEENKKSYHPPRIERLGDVRDLTRGAVLGTTDSGGQSSNPPSDPV